MLERELAEERRLAEDEARVRYWKRWGPYLAERQWGTVREDYSPHGHTWTDFPHEHARSRAYRWGEDGLLGFCDSKGRLCFGLGLWNGNDPILKERLFGLTGPEGNHGEDVKERYYYLDSTPTHSYAKALYKYPQQRFPYETLVAENARRSRLEREFELGDTGIFRESRYFDVFVEYAKAAPEDLLIHVTIANRGPDSAPLTLLSQLWYRNTWAWGRQGDEYTTRPQLAGDAEQRRIVAQHDTLGAYEFLAQEAEAAVFTENETNTPRLYGVASNHRHFKDAFHDYVIHGRREALAPDRRGTKAAFLSRIVLAPGEQRSFRMRLRALALHAVSPGAHERDMDAANPFADFDATIAARRLEAEAFYRARIPAELSEQERAIARQSHAGLLWTKQFYSYSVREWLEGDPTQPTPPPERRKGRNRGWLHLYNRDVLSMPDKWEYPWYAAWDLAFHMVPFATLDEHFAKAQLLLFLREWYMHPSGQIPAYEFKLDDVNPPVHAWAVLSVYQHGAKRGRPDRAFLARAFQKLLLNFTWWVNRKDEEGNNLFGGGFLGLDNIGVFDRSQALPTGGRLEQADGTAWMAFYCASMLQIALELAQTERVYEDLASKFFEHFVAIVDAMNHHGDTLGTDQGLWDETDGFYYDRLHLPDGSSIPLKTRSLVGILPICAVDILDAATLAALPDFSRRLRWFLEHRPDLNKLISYCDDRGGRKLLAVPSRSRLERVLARLLDESEFLSPYGVRSLSRAHREQPYRFSAGGIEQQVAYVAGESDSAMFGGNSNWRGPVWFPMNYLVIEALLKYHEFYGSEFRIECPTGSGTMMDLAEVARELSRRLCALFLPNASGERPCHGDEFEYASEPHHRELVLFYEHFDGDTGRGLGASHQTGWTSLVTSCFELLARSRRG